MFGLYSFSELPFASAVGNVFAASVVENALCLEANTATVDLACLISESLVGSDTIQGAFAVNGAVQELLTAADELNTSISINGAVIESIDVADTKTAQVAFNSSVTEALNVSETVSTAVQFITSIQEGVVAAESFIGRLLWELIDTSETSDWAPVAASSVDGWDAIDTSETSNWVPVKTQT